MRIELTDKGFADLSLTTWVPRPITVTVEPRRGFVHKARGAPGFILLSGNVHISSRLDPCYNTGHEADAELNPKFDCEFVRFPDGIEDSDSRSCESRTCKSEGCFLNLSQLLDRVARTPLQGGL